MNTPFVLVINAGGQSRRMGQPKALLAVPPADTPLLLHMVRRLLPLRPQRLLVVSNDVSLAERLGPMPLECAFVADSHPETGTLGGIATALAHLRADEGWALVLATDLPMVSPRLCAVLLNLALAPTLVDASRRPTQPWDCVVPVVGGFEEPLHALYHRRCLPAIVARLDAGERRVISFLPDVRARRVHEDELRQADPQLRSFVNANTPEEWATALALLAAEQADAAPNVSMNQE